MGEKMNNLDIITEQSEIVEGRKFIDELGNVRKAIELIYDESIPYLTWKGYHPFRMKCAYNLRICKLYWI
jgi:hypothetical protein